jgi:hypothetical protein
MTLFHIIPHRVGSNRDTQCTPASFDRHIRTQLHIFWVEWTHLLFQEASRFRPLLGMPRLLGGTQGVLPPPTILHDGQTSIHHGLECPNHLLVYNRGLPLLIISSGDTPASTAVGGTPTAFWVATGVSPGLQIFIMGGPAYTTVGGASSAFLATTESVRKHSLPYHSTFPVSAQVSKTGLVSSHHPLYRLFVVFVVCFLPGGRPAVATVGDVLAALRAAAGVARSS